MSPPPLGGDECPSLALAGTQTSTPSHSRPELPVGGLVCFWQFFFFYIVSIDLFVNDICKFSIDVFDDDIFILRKAP